MRSHNLEQPAVERSGSSGKEVEVTSANYSGAEEDAEDQVMTRVKRSLHAQKKRRKVLEQAKGSGAGKLPLPLREGAVRRSLVYAYRDRKVKSATVRGSGITRINGRGAGERAVVQPVRARPRQGRHRARPEDPRGLAVSGPGRFHGDRRQAKAALARAYNPGLIHLSRQRAARARPQHRAVAATLVVLRSPSTGGIQLSRRFTQISSSGFSSKARHPDFRSESR